MSIQPPKTNPHCPFCIDSLLHPQNDPRSPAFIFLDMDGVMICGRKMPDFHERMSKLFFQMYPGESHISDHQSLYVNSELLDSNALDYLHHLIARIEMAGHRALIVLSTSWRNDATLLEFREKIFKKHIFSQHLCGKAPPEKTEISWAVDCVPDSNLKTTADAIEYWLKDHGFDPTTTNFITLDDDPSRGLLRFGSRFIHIQCLLNEKSIEQAAQILRV